MGESGKVYADVKGGFANHVVEWSPAKKIRTSGNLLVVQRPDDTWEIFRAGKELTDMVRNVGKASDLDIYQREVEDQIIHQMLIWIEPNQSD